MAADLHIHTNASDGAYTPEEVVQKALQASLKAIAITDHDTVAGITMARIAAAGKDIEIISGIEISTEFKHGDVHILGYCIDPTNYELLNYTAALQNIRKNRITKIIEKLFKLGIKLDLNEIVAQSDTTTVVCRSHVSKAMIMAGVAKTNKEVFDRYLGIGKPAYVPLDMLSPQQAIKLILAAKGVPVLAHPGCGKNNATFISELIDVGLKGIEVYHPEHNLKKIKLYSKIATKNHLLITGGSDFHGCKTRNIYCNNIGSSSVSYTVVEELKSLAN